MKQRISPGFAEPVNLSLKVAGASCSVAFSGSGSYFGTERQHPENLYSVSQPAFLATIGVSIPVATYSVRLDGF